MKMENNLWVGIMETVDYHAILRCHSNNDLKLLCLKYTRDIIQIVEESQDTLTQKKS